LVAISQSSPPGVPEVAAVDTVGVEAEVTEVARMVVAAISEAEGTSRVVAEDMGDVGGTAVMEDTAAIGEVTEGEEATDIAAVTVVGAGAAWVSDSDCTTRLCPSITQPFGARTECLITTRMTTTINGKEVRTSMKL
jgi:hypothetical protein